MTRCCRQPSLLPSIAEVPHRGRISVAALRLWDQESQMDMKTFKRSYVPDTSKKYPIHFFVRGHKYKLFGFIETDLHLFGCGDGGQPYI